ncbi:MAG TPA: acetyl-CoA hydrolase/transferase C-terminal domain-containing protein [Burkholderiaceae bacterium]|nr:acetyl-CoA hydrolase/transferase C-terminal domain-containing protein [Burkholderiaceae bacterium]
MPPQLRKLTDSFRPGERVYAPGIAGESALLAEELRADPERAADMHFMSVQFPGIDTLDYLDLHPRARLTAFFMSPSVRRELASGRVTLMGAEYASITHFLRNGPAVDLAIAHVSPPDEHGRCSPGISADFLPLVWSRARRRVAHINPRMPRTQGTFSVGMDELDGYIEADGPLLEYREPELGKTDLRIGAHAASLIQDGDTLQIGIGTVPLALGAALRGHQGLKIHAGMVTRVARDLAQAGALDPDARITTGLSLGDATLHDFAARDRRTWFTDAGQTHDVAAIGRIPRFIAVNSAIEVDLFGQINAERAAGALQAGAGGLPVFAQGAMLSPGGRLLICLRATAARGTVSRIVPALDARAMCTVPRHLADVVITEHGIAELRGRSMEERAIALITIAAPEHRNGLAAAWERLRAEL